MARSSNTNTNTNTTPFQSPFSWEKVIWDEGEDLPLIKEFFGLIEEEDGCEYSSASTCFYVRKLMSEKYRMKDSQGKDVPSMLFHITEDAEFPWLYFTDKASVANQARQKWRPLPLAVITGLRDRGVPVFKLPNFNKSSRELIDGIAEQHSKTA